MNLNHAGLRVIGSEMSSSDRDVYGEALESDIAVRNYLAPMQKHYLGTGATGMWLNKPGKLIMEVNGEIHYIDEPLLTFEALSAFAQAVAIASPQQQSIGHHKPTLSATLPDGERIQIMMPPVLEPGLFSLSIRIPNPTIFTFDEYEASGAFSNYVWPRPKDLDSKLQMLSNDDQVLTKNLIDGSLRDFLIEAVIRKKNIAVVGDTGSGKTALMKSMCQYIPAAERLITIEDVRELRLTDHPNCSHLLYTHARSGTASITPADLIADCMRMDPSRVLLAELRGSEAWNYLKLLTSGHSGSLTSWHAESCALAFERFMFMAKENTEAASLSRSELKHLALLTIDIVIHVKRVVYKVDGVVKVKRYIDEVFFDPWAKNNARFGNHAVV